MESQGQESQGQYTDLAAAKVSWVGSSCVYGDPVA